MPTAPISHGIVLDFLINPKMANFANNLRKEGSFSLATDAYKFVLKKELNQKATGQALLGLAKTFEDQIIPIETQGYYPLFF
ncbi:MAG: hypothetical protein Ct9H300mP2_1420 [Candidatus Neomarinimicrobiota bacterium]|nr:MAG: hypothetical protein Ct9H300mP2_1420 [Candidatus Neomarinimicrobiota bacterium]